MSEDKLTLYTAKGLSKEEAHQLVKFNESGRPGVAKLNVNALQALFNVGYTCQELADQFPEYPIGAILLARVQQEWDKKRDEYRKGLEISMVGHIKDARIESVKMLSDIIKATNVAWKQELMRYLANPEKEKAPDFLPKSIHQYGSLASLLKDLTEPKDSSKDMPGANGGGLPTIIINNNNGNPASKGDIEVTSHAERVKRALARENKK